MRVLNKAEPVGGGRLDGGMLVGTPAVRAYGAAVWEEGGGGAKMLEDLAYFVLPVPFIPSSHLSLNDTLLFGLF